MCTVSIISTAGGYRLVHSRDEQRTRAPGEPPEVRAEGGLRVVSPRDPDAGGTWLAAREDGLTLAIMNVNPEGGGPRGERSRGMIVHDLGVRIPNRPSRTAVKSTTAEIDPRLYSPFRLIAVWIENGRARAEAWAWHGEGALENEPAGPPVCWASSGLGDAAVASRLPLFSELVGADPTPQNQDAYHRHRWAGRGAESVLMSRADARTVSICAVETGCGGGSGGVRMTHTEIPEDGSPNGTAGLGPAEVITLR